MYIKKIFLNNFRNLKKLEFQPSEHFNVLWGENAQGKTNILEGIYLLSHLKSFRGSPVHELIRWDASISRLFCEVGLEEIQTTIELTLQGQQKSARVNNKTISRVSDFFGALVTILFSPEEAGITRGYPVGRRALLDRAIFFTDPSFLDRARLYQRCLQQRNRLLKDKACAALLLPWTEELIETGCHLRRDRLEYLRVLAPRVRYIYRQITADREQADLFYSVPADSMDSLRKVFRQELSQAALQEQRLGRTLVGPHRDDLIFSVNGHLLRLYGSQGQQRSVLLAFKTAQILDLEQRFGFSPILLLDDMAGELDQQRQEFFFDFLRARQGQVFITATDRHILSDKGMDDARCFHICEGMIADVSCQ